MKTTLSTLRLIALLEGISFLVLLGIAMPLKYYYNKPESVKIIGMAHGILFVLYIIFLLMVHLKLKWKISNTILAFIASLVPFGTFYADVKLFRVYSKK
jgi:integral membrane protein